MPTDPVELTQKLVQCPSVTPTEGGALRLLEDELSAAGFVCSRIDRGDVSNLFARWGQGRTLGFNGHTDVVPLGDEGAWTVRPFGGDIADGFLWGRGATDMKSGVAAFAAAAIDFVQDTPPDGSVVLTITGDEEGPALDGTAAILDWMAANEEHMDACIVGEPTCPNEMGDAIKIGRRGSMTAYFTATGVQGHSAYLDRAKNPVPALARLMALLDAHQMDTGTDHFEPSTLAVTTFDTGNRANNVVPATCSATVNIRFNDAHSSGAITEWLRQEADQIARDTGIAIDFEVKVSGESFVTPPGEFSELVRAAVQAETNRVPELSTSGGTSDARFVKDHCPVVEVGLVGKTMHQVDERVEVVQIHQLKAIYTRILQGFFA